MIILLYAHDTLYVHNKKNVHKTQKHLHNHHNTQLTTHHTKQTARACAVYGVHCPEADVVLTAKLCDVNVVALTMTYPKTYSTFPPCPIPAHSQYLPDFCCRHSHSNALATHELHICTIYICISYDGSRYMVLYIIVHMWFVYHHLCLDYVVVTT